MNGFIATPENAAQQLEKVSTAVPMEGNLPYADQPNDEMRAVKAPPSRTSIGWRGGRHRVLTSLEAPRGSVASA